MNKPFEQRVVNYLERPTSSDLNIAQSQINANHRALQKYLMQAADGATFGAIGNSFRVTATVGMGLAIQPGLLTSGISTGEYLNIGSVTGLNDFYPQRTMFLSAARNLTIPTAPAAGLCRRDVIAVRYLQGAEGLTDNETTDIYNPLAVAFASEDVEKTLTTDLLNAALEVIDYTETPTQPIVYIKGQEFAYTGPDSFLTNLAPLTSVPGYANIAIINVGPNQTTFTAQDIIDHRRHAAPYGNITITGKATVGFGASGSTAAPGGALSNVVIKAPAGIRASIYRLGYNQPSGEQTNSYVLAVFGARAVTSASISVTPGIPNPDVVGDSDSRIYPVQVLTGEILLNSVTNFVAQGVYSDSLFSSPTQQIAVNQGTHFFPFTLGTVETNVTVGSTTVTTPVINSDPGEIAIGPSGSNYPGGDWEVQNVNNNAPPLYGSPTLYPTSIPSMPANTYNISNDLPSSDAALTGSIPTGVWTAIVGFASAEGWQTGLTRQDGFWQFSIYAASEQVSTETPPIKARARLGKFDGTSLVELAISGEVAIPLGGADNLFQIVFSIPESGLIPTADQLTIGIEMYNMYGSASTYYVKWGNTFFAKLDTPLLLATPKVTIPSPPSAYPAGTYPVANVDPGEVEVVVPTTSVSTLTNFNPKAVRFQRWGTPPDVVDYLTLPITFTVNLSML